MLCSASPRAPHASGQRHTTVSGDSRQFLYVRTLQFLLVTLRRDVTRMKFSDQTLPFPGTSSRARLGVNRNRDYHSAYLKFSGISALKECVKKNLCCPCV